MTQVDPYPGFFTGWPASSTPAYRRAMSSPGKCSVELREQFEEAQILGLAAGVDSPCDVGASGENLEIMRLHERPGPTSMKKRTPSSVSLAYHFGEVEAVHSLLHDGLGGSLAVGR